jgi:hypothetical protein
MRIPIAFAGHKQGSLNLNLYGDSMAACRCVIERDWVREIDAAVERSILESHQEVSDGILQEARSAT